MRVVIGLGGNVGNVPKTFEEAISHIQYRILRYHRGYLKKIAPLISSDPVDYLEQPRFLNTGILLQWSSSLHQLLRICQEIETALGRDREHEIIKGPRPIDIDILYAGRNHVLHHPRITVPHPRLHQRGFALITLLSLLPSAVDPLTDRAYQAYLEEVSTQGIYYEEWEYYNAATKEMRGVHGSITNAPGGGDSKTDLSDPGF